MKKYYLFYFVGGFTDTYLKREIQRKELYLDGERLYFSRHNDNYIERVYGPFENENDPLLDIIISARKSYIIMEIKEND